MNSFKVRLQAWIKRLLRPVGRPLKRFAKPMYQRLRTGWRALQAHHQVGKLLPILERTVENLRHEREQSDQLILALYQTLNYPPGVSEKRIPANFAVPLGNQRLLVAHPHAPFMLLDTDDLSTTPRIVLNRYQPGVSTALRRLVRPGEVALDLDAAPGFHTLTLAVAVGNRGRVDAFVHAEREQEMLGTNLTATGLRNVTRCWLNQEPVALLKEIGRSPNLIRVGARVRVATIVELLSVPNVRFVFSWALEQETHPIAAALHAAGLNFWTIDPDGTLFRTTWDEMARNGAVGEAHYVAGRSLE